MNQGAKESKPDDPENLDRYFGKMGRHMQSSHIIGQYHDISCYTYHDIPCYTYHDISCYTLETNRIKRGFEFEIPTITPQPFEPMTITPQPFEPMCHGWPDADDGAVVCGGLVAVRLLESSASSSDKLKALVDNTDTYYEILQMVTTCIPVEYRNAMVCYDESHLKG